MRPVQPLCLLASASGFASVQASEANDCTQFFVGDKTSVAKQYHHHGNITALWYDLLKPPSLDVEATGIPSLRRMLYHFPATEKMDVVRKICRTELPLALNGLDLCCGKPLSQRKADVEATISASKAEFVDAIYHVCHTGGGMYIASNPPLVMLIMRRQLLHITATQSLSRYGLTLRNYTRR